MGENAGLLAGVPRQAMAEVALQVGNDLTISAEGLIEEAQPHFGLCHEIGPAARRLGDFVAGTALHNLAAP
jgi:hypothetical protein